MSRNRISIELYVDDKGTAHVKQFSDQASRELGKVADTSNQVTSRIQSGWQKVKDSWVEVVAGIYAVKEAWDLANIAAKARQEKQAFENMAASHGANSSKLISDLKRVSRATIDTMTLVRTAGTAMMMGITPTKITKLMEIAAATSKMTGQSVTKAFEDISLAVGRQSKMILDNLGIIVQVEKANKEYAQSIGKTSSSLTDAERKQAFMNATIKAGEELMKRLGEQADTASDRLQRLNATLENMKVTGGEGALRVFFFLEGTLRSVAAVALAASGGIFKTIEAVESLLNKIPGVNLETEKWRINSEAAFTGAEALAFQSNRAFKDAFETVKEGATVQGSFKKNIEETTGALNDQGEASKKAAEAAKRRLEIAKEFDAYNVETFNKRMEYQAKLYALQNEEVENSKTAYKNIEQFGVQAARNIQDAFSDFFYDAFTGELDGAEEYFAQFTKTLTRTWSNMLSQMLMESIMTSNAMSAGGGFLSGLFNIGGGFQVVQGVSGAATAAQMGIPNVITIWHGGGIPGRDSALTRMVSPEIFAHAPRAHTGLGPRERPVIVRDDEGIFTPAQMRALAPVSGSAQEVHNHYYFNINAVDSKSFSELTKRNPQAIIGPIIEGINNNDTALRSAINTATGK